MKNIKRNLIVCLISAFALSTALPSTAATIEVVPECSELPPLAQSDTEFVENQTLCQISGVSATSTYGTTEIWSGVYVTSPNRTYSTVVGRLLVPSRNPNSCQGSTLASWVGIGGVHSANLLQAGITYVKGSSYPQAFYQYSHAQGGGNLQIFNMTLHVGDTVNMSVIYNRATEVAELSLWNISTGITRVARIYTPDAFWDGTTAEWIDERLTIDGIQGPYASPLMNFDQNSWYGAKVIKSDGLWHSMGSEDNKVLAMEANNRGLAHPDGALFQSMNFLDTFDMCE